MVNGGKTLGSVNHEQIAKFCASLANTSRLAILETLGRTENCAGDINEVAGLSRFTVGMNLKYLKKYGLIKGSLTSKNISYCLDYEKLEELKNLFDQFYNRITENKPKAENGNVSCTNKK